MWPSQKSGLVATVCSSLKRFVEAILRWVFFTLNLFMLALYICQN